MRRDGRMLFAITTLAVLFATAGVTGWAYRRDVSREQAAARIDERARWISQPKRDPHSAAHFGATAFKIPSALGWIDPGVDPWSGVSVFLEAHKRNLPGHAPADDAAAVQRFGELTVATTVQLLVPLLVILLGFSAFTGERELGTLRQLMSLGVPTRALVLGKLLANTLVLACVLVPATVVAVMVVTTASESPRTDLARFAVAIACYAMYLTMFLAVTLASSAIARSSGIALVALIAFWFANGLVAPRLAADLAMHRYPVPSAVQLADSEQSITGAFRKKRITREQFEVEQRARYGVRTTAELPINIAGLWMQRNEEMTNRAIDSTLAPLVRSYDAQERLRARLASVAPMLAIESLSMAFAGSDFAHQRAFVDSAESYRRALVRTLNLAVAENPQKDSVRFMAGRDVWERVPAFVYRHPSVVHVLGGQRSQMLALALWLVTAIALLRIGSRRLRVEP